MSEVLTYERNQHVDSLRLLTEVEHLRSAMSPDGTIPNLILEDVRTNLQTAVYEISMPMGVSVTAHRVEYLEDLAGERKRVITWLGKNAVEVALSGQKYHYSEAALRRVAIEVEEAERAQEHLNPGIAQIFISPKMSEADASEQIAEDEHLLHEDSLRVSYAVTDSSNRVVARRLESLLVRDVPLKAWVALLKDPNNIFSKSFSLNNEYSALSVMEIFAELELYEEDIKEGPVSLVEAVLPYILDESAKLSVRNQLEGFKGDQEKYRSQAEETADEWLSFEIEQTHSLKLGYATSRIKAFIISNQHLWTDKNLNMLLNHQFGDNYIYTTELAVMLEDAKRQIINSLAGLMTGNADMIKQIDSKDLHDIIENKQYLNVLRQQNTDQYIINRVTQELNRKIAKANIAVGGGCAGGSKNNFIDSETDIMNDSPDSQYRKDWRWTKGKCQVKTCPSPNPTEVGPCSVCRRCQRLFDKGEDPTKNISVNSTAR